MGYDLHITRKEDWFDDKPQLDILFQEWEAFVANDPEIQVDDTAKIFTTEGERRLYKWLRIVQTEDDYVWFDFDRGNIDVKNPDDETIKKMCKIATLLNARVQGDDGEIY